MTIGTVRPFCFCQSGVSQSLGIAIVARQAAAACQSGVPTRVSSASSPSSRAGGIEGMSSLELKISAAAGARIERGMLRSPGRQAAPDTMTGSNGVNSSRVRFIRRAGRRLARRARTGSSSASASPRSGSRSIMRVTLRIFSSLALRNSFDNARTPSAAPLSTSAIAVLQREFARPDPLVALDQARCRAASGRLRLLACCLRLHRRRVGCAEPSRRTASLAGG